MLSEALGNFDFKLEETNTAEQIARAQADWVGDIGPQGHPAIGPHGHGGMGPQGKEARGPDAV